MEYYHKYLKYKTKYFNYKNKLSGLAKYKTAACYNMEGYAKSMEGPVFIKPGELTINFKFRFLDNKNECMQEAYNFLKNKDKNMNYLKKSLQNFNLNIKSDIPYYENQDELNMEVKITEIIIVAIGSSSTQAYYFVEKSGEFIPMMIELGNGAWYGVQNNKDSSLKLEEFYLKISTEAKKLNIKYVIIHKSGSFGFKHFKSPEMVIPIDQKISNCLQFSEKDLVDVKKRNAYETLNKLMDVIITNKNKENEKDNLKWLSVANFNCFEADWFKNIAEEYFKRYTTETKLYIMDFGGGSDTLCEVSKKEDGTLTYTDLFKGTYDQENALSFIDREEIFTHQVLNGYKNNDVNISIKEQIIFEIKKRINHGDVTVYIYQTGIQREWISSDWCDKKELLTTDNIWS